MGGEAVRGNDLAEWRGVTGNATWNDLGGSVSGVPDVDWRPVVAKCSGSYFADLDGSAKISAPMSKGFANVLSLKLATVIVTRSMIAGGYKQQILPLPRALADRLSFEVSKIQPSPDFAINASKKCP